MNTFGFSNATPRHSSSGHHHSSSSRGTSYYKRSSRPGFIQRFLRDLRKLIRSFWERLKRNPIKTLLPIIMALASSGALATYARKIGLSLPDGLSSLIGGSSGRRGFERRSGGAAYGLGDASTWSGALRMAGSFL